MIVYLQSVVTTDRTEHHQASTTICFAPLQAIRLCHTIRDDDSSWWSVLYKMKCTGNTGTGDKQRQHQWQHPKLDGRRNRRTNRHNSRHHATWRRYYWWEVRHVRLILIRDGNAKEEVDHFNVSRAFTQQPLVKLLQHLNYIYHFQQSITTARCTHFASPHLCSTCFRFTIACGACTRFMEITHKRTYHEQT